MPSKSRSQQRLMGAAYAYAKGDIKDAPESIKKVAKSFLKKGKKKGEKALRDFAKTKHKGLKENHIFRFDEFVLIKKTSEKSEVFFIKTEFRVLLQPNL